MNAILLSFAWFVLGVLVGAFVLAVLWRLTGPPLLKKVFERILREQGYEICDKRIVPMVQTPTPAEQTAKFEADVEEVLSRIMEQF